MAEPEYIYYREDSEPLEGELAEQGYRVVRLATPLDTKVTLIEELRVALGLPDYMGANYDALYDCLTDSYVLGEQPKLLIVLEATEALQISDREAFHGFLELYDQAGRFWRQRGGDLRLCLVV